jgi:glycosyltransferase involved in cell wall biosynthesis
MQQIRKSHILHLPRWYPSIDNPQSGIFIKKQIQAMAHKYCHSVVYVRGSQEVTKPITIENSTAQLHEFYYFFPHKHLIYNLFQTAYGYLHLLYLVLKKRGKPHLIHAHVLLRTYLVGCALKLIFRIPLIYSEHWSGFRDGSLKKKGSIYFLMTYMAFKYCDQVIVVSNRLGNDIVNLKLIRKFSVIPNIVSPAKTKEPELNLNKIKFVTVADLNDFNKDISSIIKAFSSLIPLYNIEYHIIGDGPDRCLLEQLAGSYLNEQIMFHGMKSNQEVLSNLHQYDVLISNSRYETFGIVVIEAISAGLPVICTKEGCPEDALTLPVGIFINPNSPDELNNAMRQMILHHQNFKPESSIKKIMTLFSEDTVGKDMCQLYDSFLIR